MSNFVHKTRMHLHRALRGLGHDGYDVAALSADAHSDVIRWCDAMIRDAKPKWLRGHGLSRMDAGAALEDVGFLRGRAHRFVNAVNGAVKQHDQAIVAHNRRARDRARQLRAKRKKGEQR